ncbi:MAG: molybdopterin-dependent oxidoreductase, partial [Chloroflexi bacterium]|nr:molybdopterin-dependent oxidoreductase [Chloroflexota bacterium]
MNANSKKTFCRICEAACGLVATRDENGNVIQLRPDKAHPVSKGYMCAKGVRFADVANHPERILRPQLRGENGRFHPISWSQAIDTIVQKIKPIQQQYGNHAVGVYYGNPLLFNTLGLISLLAFNKALGTRNVYSSFSQDCNNKFAAAHLMYGGEMIQPIPDLANADFALMFGTNPAISQGSFVHFDRGATAFDTFIDKGGDVLWVDPRRSESAKRWGSHLPIRPGTDIYLLLTLLHELRDLYRPDTAVTGMDALLELAAGYPVEKTAVFTHIPINQIQTLATKLRQSNQTAFHMSVG